MADPIVTVSERLEPAFAKVAGVGAPIVEPVVRRSDRADAQVNGSLALSKQLGKAPRDVAQAILDVAELTDICSAVEIAGPGFVNLTFSNEFLASELARAAADPRLGVRLAPVAIVAVVDYSAPNVAKEMHVGHLRSTVIGDSLVRMLSFVGHRVIRENHIGDWGTPFGMLIEHLVDLDDGSLAEELSVSDLDSFYRQARTKFDSSDEFKERARQRVVLLQSGDVETLKLWNVLVEESMRHYTSVYDSLGVLLTESDLKGESTYNQLLPEVVDRLTAKGMLTLSDGAEVVFVPGFVNRENEPLPLIIRKTDGGYNYATSDLACVIDRVERLGASLMLYVVGAPQAQHLQMVEAVARQAGWLPSSTQMLHIAFGNVLGTDRKILKSRSGDVVKLDALLAEAIERATSAVKEKNPQLDSEHQLEIARQVGIGAVKYADLSTDRIKDYMFDWDRMLSFDGNTSPYLQYAHARICSIFRKANVDRSSVRSVKPIIGHAAERTLTLRILQFDTAVWDTLEKFSPHRLCTYLHDLATEFSVFYEHCPVLRADSEVQRSSRLALCDMTARVLQSGLGLLGIDAPEQM